MMNKPKILLVDDSPVTLRIITSILGENYIIKTAKDGNEALMLTEEYHPDLILMDILMPGISGLKVCQILSNDEVYSDIPIILVTSFSDAGAVKDGLEAGAVDFITKPFSQTEITARINSALRLKHFVELLKQSDYEKYILMNELNQIKVSIAEKDEIIQNYHHYVHKVQQLLLSLDRHFDSVFKDHFIIYQSKEKVSGDKYWLKKCREKIIVSVIDCHGQDVKAAYETAIVLSSLDTIVDENQTCDPVKILEDLDQTIQTESEQNPALIEQIDRMDISLCVINVKMQQLHFACTKGTLFHVQNSQITEVSTTKNTMGEKQNETLPRFIIHSVPFQSRDMIYLLTDGFMNQLNPEGDRFGSERLKGLLLQIIQLNCSEQKRILVNEFQNHHGTLEQQDDVTVIGMRLDILI